jgi:group I intron endonuclease
MKISATYFITNTLNQMKYVGSSVDVKQRLSGHRQLLKNNKHHNPHLQNAYNKYNKDNFTFDIIKEVPVGSSYKIQS